MLTDGLSVWTAAGCGAGEVTVAPEGEEALTAELTMSMGAAGLRSEGLTPAAHGGLSLAVKGDGRFTRTSPGSACASSGGRLEAEVGFGLAMPGGVFTGTPHAGLGLSESGRDYRLGWRLTSAVRGENDDAPAEHGLMPHGSIRW